MTAVDVVCVNFVCIRNAVLCRKAAEEYVSKRVCFASGVVMKKETALEEVANKDSWTRSLELYHLV